MKNIVTVVSRLVICVGCLLMVAGQAFAAPPVVEITAPSGNSEFWHGEHVSFEGHATDEEGTAITGSNLVWTSNKDGRIGTSTSFSTDTLVSGAHTITLTAADGDGVSASASVMLTIKNHLPVCSITNPVSGSEFAGGVPIAFAGTGQDEDDGRLSGESLVWTSDRQGQIGTGTSFSRDDLSSGQHLITLTATDADGAHNEVLRQVAITVGNHPPVATILNPASGSTFPCKSTVVFSGQGSDDEDGKLSGASLAWSSDREGSLGTGASLSTDKLSSGTHVITLKVTDSVGASDEVSVTINMKNAAPVVTITSPTTDSRFYKGDAVSFVGQADDVEDDVLPESAFVWRSGVDGELGSGSRLSVDTLSEGTHTITLEVRDSDGDSGKAGISVKIGNEKPVATITAPPSGTRVKLGEQVVFSGTGNDAEDGTLGGGSLKWNSSLDGELGEGEAIAADELSAGVHVITLTVTDSRGETGSATINVIVEDNVPTVAINQPADGSTVKLGETVTFKGTGTDGEGHDLADDDLVWSSSLDDKLGDGKTLVCDNLSAGVHVITLTATDAAGLHAGASLTLTVTNDAPEARIDGPADNSRFALGETITFNGRGDDPEDGVSPAAALSWSSNIDGELGKGAVFSCSDLSRGRHLVTLTVTDTQGEQATAEISVVVGNAEPVVVIESPRDGLQADEGEKVYLDGEATDPEDGVLDAQSLTWSSNLDGELGTGKSLYVSSLTKGLHTVTLKAVDALGDAGEASVEVRVGDTVPLVSIKSPTDGSTHALGDEVLFKGGAEDDQDGTLTGDSLRWSSSIDGDLGTGEMIVAEELSAGVHIITLEAVDSDGEKAAATLTLTVENKLPEVSILTPADGSEYDLSRTVSFSGTAKDAEDGWLGDASLVWSSNRDGRLGEGTTLEVDNLCAGTHVIVLKATDSAGGSAEASIRIHVGNQAPEARIASPENGAVVDSGETIVFKGSGSDPEEGKLSGENLSWISNRQGVIGSGETCSTAALSAGTHVITLVARDSRGAEGTASITVVNGNNIPQVKITAPVQGGSAGAGEEVVFSGTATDAEDGDLDGDNVRWISSIDGDLGVGRLFTRDDLSAGTHVIELAATDEQGDTATGSITFTVTDTAPEVKIIAPSDGGDYAAGASITLNGHAHDAEDGDLTGESLEWRSHLDGVLGTGAVLPVRDLSTGTHTITLTATDKGGRKSSASITIYVGNAAPEVTITSPVMDAAFDQGEYITFSGTAVDAEEGELDDAALTWSSHRAGSLGTGKNLSLADLAAGSHRITLTARDDKGAEGKATVNITVGGTAPKPVISAPADGSTVDLGDEVVFKGGARDAEDGDLVGSRLSWSSSRDGDLGTGAVLTCDDLTPGMHVITLTATDLDGVTATSVISLTVDNAAPEAVIVSPADGAVFDAGRAVVFTGRATDKEDGVLNGSALMWNSSRDGELGTGATLRCDNLSCGTHVITLTASDADGRESAAAEITLTVGNTPPTATILRPEGGEFDRGEHIVFAGSAFDAEQGELTGESLVWMSNRDGKLGTGKTLSINTLTSGMHTVTLTATDRWGSTGGATVTIGVGNTPPEVTITQPAPGKTVAAGDEVVLAGRAVDPQDGELDGDRLQWSSNRDGDLGSGASLVCDKLTPGVHVITLSATDGNGRTGSSTVTLTVTNGKPEVTILGPADGAVFAAGVPVSLDGTGRDPEDGELDGASLVWCSHIDGQLGIGRHLKAAGLSNGMHVITLTATDAQGTGTSARVQVVIGNEAPVAKITAPADNTGFAKGMLVTLCGTADDAEDGQLSGEALTWSSDRDGSLGTGRKVTTDKLSPGVHNITLTATDSHGAGDTAQVTVCISGADGALKAEIKKPAAGAVFDKGASVEFDGTGWDETEQWLTGDSLVWTSSRDGRIGTGTHFDTDALSEGEHTVTLTVTNAFGLTRHVSVNITTGLDVPEVQILSPADQSAFYEGETVTLHGIARDADGLVLDGATCAWSSSLDGQLGSGSRLEVSSLSRGTHEIILVVTDARGRVYQKKVTVIVGTLVDAGTSCSVHEGETVVLDGSSSLKGSSGAGTFLWQQQSGPRVILKNAAAAKASFKAPYVGTAGAVLVFKLTVTDDDGHSGSDEVRVTVLDDDDSGLAEDVVTVPLKSGESLGVGFDGEGSGRVELLEDGEVPAPGRLKNLYGTLRVSADVTADDNLVTFTLFLPSPVGEGVQLYLYAGKEWVPFNADLVQGPEGAVFNEQRNKVTVTLADDGCYDLDTAAALAEMIVCLGENTADAEGSSSSGGGGGGCFVSTARRGALPLIILALAVPVLLPRRRVRVLTAMLLLAPGALWAAGSLEAVFVKQGGSLPRVMIVTSGEPARYEHFVLTDPDRVVVDLSGLSAGEPCSFSPADNSLVRRVRIDRKPDGRVRVVLDLKHPSDHKVVREASGLAVVFAAPPAETEAVADVPPGPWPETNPVASVAVPEPAGSEIAGDDAPKTGRRWGRSPWSVGLATGVLAPSAVDEFALHGKGSLVGQTWQIEDEMRPVVRLDLCRRMDHMFELTAAVEYTSLEDGGMGVLALSPALVWRGDAGVSSGIRCGALAGSISLDDVPGDFDPGFGWEVGAGVEWQTPVVPVLLGMDVAWRDLTFDFEPEKARVIETAKQELDVSGWVISASLGFRF